MGTIYAVGLGPGDLSTLPMGTYQQLKSGLSVVLRTRIHPVVRQLEEDGITFTTFDELYHSEEEFSAVYREMADRLLARARSGEDLVYAVPGHPLMAEQSVQHLIDYTADHSDVRLEIGAGNSFFDAVCTVLKVDPIEGLALLDGTALAESDLTPGRHLMIAQVFDRMVASEVKLTLMGVYPDDYPVTIVKAAGVPSLEQIQTIPLYELDRFEADQLTTVYVPPTASDVVLGRDPWHATGLVHRLRQPDGCPWDREQTHASLRRYVLEEAYEVAAAIDAEDPEALAAELGDLLLQILLHAEIASEWGDFTLRDVYAALSDKLIRRHPHVFGDADAQTPQEAEEAWRQAKSAEHEDTESSSILSHVRMGRPTADVARDLQASAAGVGFDWPDVHAVMEKLQEEVAELQSEIEQNRVESAKNELGDVLFVIVNLARWLNCEVEETLSRTIRKFIRRFHHVERRVAENGGWSGISSNQLESFWDEAKSMESRAD